MLLLSRGAYGLRPCNGSQDGTAIIGRLPVFISRSVTFPARIDMNFFLTDGPRWPGAHHHGLLDGRYHFFSQKAVQEFFGGRLSAAGFFSLQ